MLTSNNVSVFELLNSGAVCAMIEYLKGSDLPNAPNHDELRLKRLASFARYSLASEGAHHAPLLALVRKLQSALSSSEAFPVLCSRLAPAPSSARQLSRSSSGSRSLNNGGSLSSGLAALTQPFKLRLVRHPQVSCLFSMRLQAHSFQQLHGIDRLCVQCCDHLTFSEQASQWYCCLDVKTCSGMSLTWSAWFLCKLCCSHNTKHWPQAMVADCCAVACGVTSVLLSLQEAVIKEYPPNIVLIEPLATMNAIEDFLWPRVSRGVPTEAIRSRSFTPANAGAGASHEHTAVADASRAAAASQENAHATTAEPGGVAYARNGVAASSGRGEAPPPASRAQLIPDDSSNRRLTRAAAARARAEAQARAEEAVEERRAAAVAGGSAGGGGGSAPMSEDSEGDLDDEDMMMHDHMDTEDHGEDHDDDDEEHGHVFDEEEDGEEDDDEELEDADMHIGSMPVHDLHLGDGPSGSFRSDAAAEVARASAPATHAAAAAGMSETNAAGSAPARTAASVAAQAAAQPKLTFYMNDQPLSAATTVFQAVQQLHLSSSREDGDEQDEATASGVPRRGRRLWDDVYTLHYGVAGSSTAGPSAEASAAAAATAGTSTQPAAGHGQGKPPTGRRQGSHHGSAGARTMGGLTAALANTDSRWRQSPLYELLAVALPDDLAAPDSCREILHLLQLLEGVNRLGPRLVSCHELQDSVDEQVRQQDARPQI